MPAPNTIARLHYADPGWLRYEGKRMIPTGEVRLEVPQYLNGHELEYQTYVNFGAWSNFQTAPNGILRVRNPMLSLLGHHTVYLRARIKGQYRTLEDTPTTVSFTFDPLAPNVNIAKKKGSKGSLSIQAFDQVSPTKDLIYAYRLDDKWISFSGPTLKLPSSALAQDAVDIRVRDRSGNTRLVQWSTKKQQITSQESYQNNLPLDPNAPQACGCSSSPTAPDVLPWWLLALAFIPFLRRRRS